VVGAEEASLSEGGTGSALRWFAGAAHPACPATGSGSWASRGVSPDPSHCPHHLGRAWGVEELLGKQNFSLVLSLESHRFYTEERNESVQTNK